MKLIKLMPDYQCFPLWEASPQKIGNVDPTSLAISPELLLRLAEWAAKFDATLNLDDPMCSGFQSENDEREFAEEGKRLCADLQSELGSDYVISYQMSIA